MLARQDAWTFEDYALAGVSDWRTLAYRVEGVNGIRGGGSPPATNTPEEAQHLKESQKTHAARNTAYDKAVSDGKITDSEKNTVAATPQATVENRLKKAAHDGGIQGDVEKTVVSTATPETIATIKKEAKAAVAKNDSGVVTYDTSDYNAATKTYTADNTYFDTATPAGKDLKTLKDAKDDGRSIDELKDVSRSYRTQIADLKAKGYDTSALEQARSGIKNSIASLKVTEDRVVRDVRNRLTYRGALDAQRANLESQKDPFDADKAAADRRIQEGVALFNEGDGIVEHWGWGNEHNNIDRAKALKYMDEDKVRDALSDGTITDAEKNHIMGTMNDWISAQSRQHNGIADPKALAAVQMMSTSVLDYYVAKVQGDQIGQKIADTSSEINRQDAIIKTETDLLSKDAQASVKVGGDPLTVDQTSGTNRTGTGTGNGADSTGATGTGSTGTGNSTGDGGTGNTDGTGNGSTAGATAGPTIDEAQIRQQIVQEHGNLGSSYTVQGGDYLIKIANDYNRAYGLNLTYQDIANANAQAISNPNMIGVSWQLNIPQVNEAINALVKQREDFINGAQAAQALARELADLPVG